jgi:hypothetical protein
VRSEANPLAPTNSFEFNAFAVGSRNHESPDRILAVVFGYRFETFLLVCDLDNLPSAGELVHGFRYFPV